MWSSMYPKSLIGSSPVAFGGLNAFPRGWRAWPPNSAFQTSAIGVPKRRAKSTANGTIWARFNTIWPASDPFTRRAICTTHASRPWTRQMRQETARRARKHLCLARWALACRSRRFKMRQSSIGRDRWRTDQSKSRKLTFMTRCTVVHCSKARLVRKRTDQNYGQAPCSVKWHNAIEHSMKSCAVKWWKKSFFRTSCSFKVFSCYLEHSQLFK